MLRIDNVRTKKLKKKIKDEDDLDDDEDIQDEVNIDSPDEKVPNEEQKEIPNKLQKLHKKFKTLQNKNVASKKTYKSSDPNSSIAD